jgi:starch phosphorylase
MKFMMNGAVTIGTMDGANIEIVEHAGKENEVIFGLSADEVEEYYRNGQYNPWDLYHNDKDIHAILESLFVGEWTRFKPDRFRMIFDEIMNHNDQYFVLKDLESYADAQAKINDLYQDRTLWAKMCLMNIANSGTFSSDRTIKQYAEEIWGLNKIS